MNDPRVLMVDIESSFVVGSFWRPSWKMSLSHHNIIEERKVIMVSYKWLGGKKIHNMCWDVNLKTPGYIKGCDRRIIQEIVKVFDQADLIVGHNAKKFDIAYLRGRAMAHGISMNHTYPLFDTLTKTRAYMNLNSNRLDYLGTFLLDEGKATTGGFQLWIDVVINNCPKALKKMVRYCNKDVDLLERYYKKLLPYVSNNMHVGVHKGHEKFSCPYCGTHDVRLKKEYTTRTGTLRYGMVCRNNHHYPLSRSVYMQYQKWKKEQNK